MKSDTEKFRDIKLELFNSQSEIIRLQNEAIMDIVDLLMHYMTIEEVESLPAMNKINEAAMIRAEHRL